MFCVGVFLEQRKTYMFTFSPEDHHSEMNERTRCLECLRTSDSPWSQAAGEPQGTRWCSWSGRRVCAYADSWGWWWAQPSVCCRSGPAPPAAPVVPVYCGRWRYGYIRALALQTLFLGTTFINHISLVTLTWFWSNVVILDWVITQNVPCFLRQLIKAKECDLM